LIASNAATSWWSASSVVWAYTVMGVPDMAPTVLRSGVDAACILEPLLSAVQAQGRVRSVFALFTGE